MHASYLQLLLTSSYLIHLSSYESADNATSVLSEGQNCVRIREKGGIMDEQKTYVCLGSCQAVVNEEQYKNGLTTCGADSCTMKGQPLVPGKKNPETGKNETTQQEN